MYHHQWFLGYYLLGPKQLLEAKLKGQQITITGVGVLKIDPEANDELLFSVVQSIRIWGKTICSQTARKHYGMK